MDAGNTFEWLMANAAWILLFAIIAISVVWAVASRSKSKHWGHPEEFAGTMPEERRDPVDQDYLAGRRTTEDWDNSGRPPRE